MIVYVRELYKPSLIYKLFGKFKIEEIQGKTIINLPINSKSHKRRVKRITEKLCKYLYKNSIRNVVLEQELFNNEEFKNTLYSNNENILDGSKLAKFLVYKVIQKVFNLKNKNIQAGEVTILANQNDDITIEHIMQTARNAKRLNIITSNTKKFKNLIDYLFEELGILIKLSNNLNFNLKSSDVIVNMDFTEENLNKLAIPNNATIVNVQKNIDIYSKKFAGINIKTWEINIPSDIKLNGFLDNHLYEALLFTMIPIKAFEQIEKDNITIKKLIGKNGAINKKEFK